MHIHCSNNQPCLLDIYLKPKPSGLRCVSRQGTGSANFQYSESANKHNMQLYTYNSELLSYVILKRHLCHPCTSKLIHFYSFFYLTKSFILTDILFNFHYHPNLKYLQIVFIFDSETTIFSPTNRMDSYFNCFSS